MKKLAYILLIVFTGCSDGNKKESEANEKVVNTEIKSDKTDLIILSREKLLDKELNELRVIRNEVFARHGYIFNSHDLDSIFRTKEWYSPSKTNVDKDLTEVEKEYIKMIVEIEEEKTNSGFVKKELKRLISEYELPLNISKIVDIIGKPDSTFIDDDFTCPVGQIHFWKTKGLTFLEDNYSGKKTYDKDVRLFISYNSELIGMHKSDIEGLLQNEELIFDFRKNTNVLERFLADISTEFILINIDNMYVTLRFDLDLKIKYIMISTMDVNGAC